MVKIKKFIAYLMFFILALMYFTPKISIYYFLENELKKYDLIISEEKLSDSGFNLRITDAIVSVKSIQSANISQVDVKIYGIYNTLLLQDIVLSSAASAFIPLSIQKADISYTIFNPLNIKANFVGEFGVVDAKINILNRTLHLDLIPSKIMLQDYSSTLDNLKKSENGRYIFDKNF